MAKIRTLRLEALPSNRAEVYEGETVRFTFDAAGYQYEETITMGVPLPGAKQYPYQIYTDFKIGDSFDLLTTYGDEISKFDIKGQESKLGSLVLFDETMIDSSGKASWEYTFIEDNFTEVVETASISFHRVFNDGKSVREKVELAVLDNPENSSKEQVAVSNVTNNTTNVKINNFGSGNVSVGDIGSVNNVTTISSYFYLQTTNVDLSAAIAGESRKGEWVWGTEGDDLISDGRGKDNLIGGDGADQFYFAGEEPFKKKTVDKIMDFNSRKETLLAAVRRRIRKEIRL